MKRARELEEECGLGGLLRPCYEGRSILNVSESLLRHYGVDSSKGLGFDPFGTRKGIALILMDSLGFDLLVGCARDVGIAKLISRLGIEPLTSTFPSATATALATVCTALPPARHGVVGGLVFIRRLGLVANMLQLSSIADPRRDSLLSLGVKGEELMRGKTVFERLEGIRCYVMSRRQISDTGISKLVYRGADRLGFISPSDMFVRMRKLLDEGVFVFAYWDALDPIVHEYGIGEEACAEVGSFLRAMKEELLERTDASVALFGDHGQLEVDEVVEASKLKWLLKGIEIPPTGEMRASYIHPREGYLEQLEDRLSKLGLNPMRSKLAVKEGLFGGGGKLLRDRIGELVVLPSRGKVFYYSYRGGGLKVKGMHGGMEREEMLVPLLFRP